MPTSFSDDLSFEIFHAPLAPATPPKLDIAPKRLLITDLQKTLPGGWRVRETLQGRYLFASQDGDNSWDHPNPSVDRELYNADQGQFSPNYQPRYEALSYTWGSTKAPMNAYVVNPSCPGQPYTTISIGANLACALKHLRHGELPRTLWVDFLCINQSDITERNVQVNRMGNIYSYAKRVVVWLGEELEDSRHALATLQYLGEQVEYTVNQRYGDAPGCQEKEWWHDECPLPYDDRTWLSLIMLLHRPWFGRVWVLQEVQLGNHHAIVQCGVDICPWISIRKSIFILERKKGVPQELAAILNSFRMAFEPRPYLYFDNLLGWSRTRYCTDLRDKVYGILSLAPSSVSKKTEPDYTLSIAQTYKDAFLAQLEVTSRLNLLTQCRIQQRIIHGASWIPNWSIQADSFLGSHRFGHARQASGFSAAQARYFHPNILEVCGVQCARIRSVSTLTSEGESEDVFQVLRVLGLENLTACYDPTGCSLLEAGLEVTLQGRTAERYLAYTATLGFQSIVELQREFSESTSDVFCKANGFGHIGTLKDDKVSIITTYEGYIGGGPVGVKTGKFIFAPKLLQKLSDSIR